MSDGPILLKSADVARLLQVHPKQVYRLLARGLPAHRVGSEWRFSRDEVLSWSGMKLASTVVAPSHPPPPLLAANGDLVIEVLLDQLRADCKPLIGLVASDRGGALQRLTNREILLAGFHGEVPPSHVGPARLARIHLVEREVGLAFSSNIQLRSVSDLARKRVALRPSTAGVRRHFDNALAEARTSLSKLRVTHTTFDSHRDAVCAILRGEADVALTTAAWAERAGLGLMPLASEPYELLLHAEDLGTPACIGVCEVTQGRAFRSALSKIAGYKGRRAGEIRYEH